MFLIDVDVELGGLTIHDDDNVALKLVSLVLASFSIDPHRHGVVHPLVEPHFLSVNVASSW